MYIYHLHFIIYKKHKKCKCCLIENFLDNTKKNYYNNIVINNNKKYKENEYEITRITKLH